MEFKIIVTKNGKHFFTATNIHTRIDAQRVFDALRDNFPKRDGYTHEMQEWDTHGYTLAFEG